MECIFCRIAKGEVPATIVYEDEDVLAFLDVNPRAKGHTLVIPKTHAATLLDLSEEQAGVLFAAVRKVAHRLTHELGAVGLNIGLNSGQVAGQVVPHVHVHVLPRYGEEAPKGFEEAFFVKEELKKKVESAPKGLIDNLSAWI
ncbi:MAG: HIT family protein [Methermicoccaceae archaeon]